MVLNFTRATKRKSRARITIDGPAGSGKTYTALIAATVLAEGGKIAVIDTERGSASLYSDKFSFDVLELTEFSPALYTQAIDAAEKAGYAVIVIDSLSHAWEGEGGAIDLKDAASVRNKGNDWTAWRDVTPLHRRLVDAMLQSPAHVITTMRSKMDYVQEKTSEGKTIVRKVGMAPVQRPGMEYEFTIVCDMDIDHHISISKSRCELMADKVAHKPGPEFWTPFRDWLNSGDAAPITAPVAPIVTAPPSVPAPTPSNGNGSNPAASAPQSVVRTPAQVKAYVEGQALKYRGKSISDGKRGVIAPVLEACFAGGNVEMKRHEVQQFLTGKSSIREISDDYLIGLYQWLQPAKDSGGAWLPGAGVPAEAEAIINHLVTAANPALPGMGAEPNPFDQLMEGKPF